MRPIALQFAGLHSYREPQTVDFTQLLSGGLFGIFGPTGSGKSTILDAITLALYGKVERADQNNRGGIINTDEKKLWVRFSFTLAGAEGEHGYRVERSYARDVEGALRIAHARLVAVTGGNETVLADKERDVTQQVQEILGLTVEDFTRAVVLPQGKFAEFLHLKDADRRKTLQRIFALSRYGDQLNQRLKLQLEALTQRLKGVEGEQIGLGDASDAAVAAAAGRLAAAAGAVVAAQTRWQAAEQALREWQKVWDLQQELAEVQASLAAWQQQEDAARARRAEAEAAGRAESCRGPLADQAEAQRRAAAAGEKQVAAAAELTIARDAATQATAAHREARTGREQAAPRLTGRRFQLEQAVRLELEVQQLAERVRDLDGRVVKGRELTDQVQSQVEAAAGQTAGLQAGQVQVLAELTAAEVPVEQRQQVQQALAALDRLTEAAAALAEAGRRLTDREQELAATQQAAVQAETAARAATAELAGHEQGVRTLADQPPEQEDDLAASATWLARVQELVESARRLAAEEAAAQQVRAEADERSTGLASAAQAAAAAETAAREAADQARDRRTAAEAALAAVGRRHQAAALAAGLADGQPCPVCGAPDHPHPASPAGQAAVAAAEAELQAAAAALLAAEDSREAAARAAADARAQAQAAAMAAEAAGQALARAGAALAEVRTRLPAPWQASAVAELPALAAQEAEAHRQRQQRLQDWRQQVETGRRRHEELARAAAAAATAAAGLAATAQAKQQARNEAVAVAEQATAQQAGRQAEWDRVRGELDAAALQAENRRIQAADRAAAALKQRLAELNRAQEQAEHDLKEKRTRHQQYAQALQERELALAAARAELTSRQTELQQLAAGQPAAAQLQAVTAELQTLEAAETAAAAAAEAAGQRLGAADAAAAAARREDELAAGRLQEAAAALVLALSRAGFPDPAAAAAALRPPERQQELQAWLQAHGQEGDRLQHRQAELAGALGERRLDAAAWAATQTEVEQARQAWAEARDEQARASQVHGDLMDRQVRWRDLEGERVGLATRQGHLKELQTLLRGGALIDFLAEDQLHQVAREASERLGQLTRHRYALEVDSGGGFVVRDDFSGGVRRPVSTLSGGETFLTSLALALALSAHIQLRGRHPLEFFFLDEGFGTLDPELLNLVIDTLERLHFEKLHVGIISHVPELRQRLQRRLVVNPADPGGRGSRLELETL